MQRNYVNLISSTRNGKQSFVSTIFAVFSWIGKLLHTWYQAPMVSEYPASQSFSTFLSVELDVKIDSSH